MKRLITALFLFLSWVLCAGTGQAAISRTGSGAGTTSFTFSATATGDMKIVFAYRSGSTTAPSLPAGWTSIATASTAAGGTTGSLRIGCNVSSSGADTGSGTWTNATNTVGISYSGTMVDVTANCNITGIGNKATNNAKTSTSANFPAITVQNTDNWVAGFLGDSASSLCAPAGMTSVASLGTARANDTNGVVSSWSSTNCTVSSSTWMTEVVEIVGPPVACSSAPCPTLVQHKSDMVMLFSDSVTTLKVKFVNKTKAGNAIIIVAAWDAASDTSSCVDDKTNTYSTAAVTGNGSHELKAFLALNVAVDTQLVTCTFTGGAGTVQVKLYEWMNVATSAALDGSSVNSAGSGGQISTGSFTPTVSGDLIFAAYDIAGIGVNPTAPIRWTAGPGFFASGKDGVSFSAEHYRVQGTAGAINPTIVQSQTAATAILAIGFGLKAASAGSTFSGIHVNSHVVMNMPSTMGTLSGTSFTWQFPSFGNALAIAWHGADNQRPTSITDNKTNTWNSSTNIAVGDFGIGDIWYWYTCGAITGQDLSITMVTQATPSNIVLTFYDISGAASTSSTACHDTDAGLGPGQSFGFSSGSFNGVSITPSTANGVILSAIQENSETATNVSPGVFAGHDIGIYSAFDGNEDGGYAVYYNPDTSAVTFNWTYSAYEAGSPIVGSWVNQAMALKAPAAPSGPPSQLPTLGCCGVASLSMGNPASPGGVSSYSLNFSIAPDLISLASYPACDAAADCKAGVRICQAGTSTKCADFFAGDGQADLYLIRKQGTSATQAFKAGTAQYSAPPAFGVIP